MKASLREEVKQLSEDYMELYVSLFCKTRASNITKSELAMFKYDEIQRKKKFHDNVLKDLFDNCIYEPMRVKAIQDLLSEIIKKQFMNEIFKHLKQQTLNNAVAEANKEHQLVVTIRRN